MYANNDYPGADKRSFGQYDTFNQGGAPPKRHRLTQDVESKLSFYVAREADSLKAKIDDLLLWSVPFEPPTIAALAYLQQTIAQYIHLSSGGVDYPTMNPPTPNMPNARERELDAVARQETNLFVSGLPTQADDDFMMKLFGPFGPVKSVRTFPGNETRGKYGFCRMVNHADAAAAVAALHKTPYALSPMGSLWVAFKRAGDKDDRPPRV